MHHVHGQHSMPIMSGEDQVGDVDPTVVHTLRPAAAEVAVSEQRSVVTAMSTSRDARCGRGFRTCT